jgi:hypothetical protein
MILHFVCMQCNFTDCSATVTGGAFSANTDGNIVIDTCYFSGSSAVSGGAISLAATGNAVKHTVLFNITRSVFDNNRNSDRGNAIYVTSGVVLSISHSTVRNNVYKQQEAVFTTAAVTYVSDSLFHDDSGGAISTANIPGPQLVIVRSNFTNNDALDISSAIQAQGASLYLSQVRVHIQIMQL